MDAEVALLKALAEPTRLRLAALLALNGETCVCELAAALAAPAFRVSRHLAIMKDRGLVEARRQGTWMHYRLAGPRGKLEGCLQECFRDCLAEHPSVVADRRRLGAHRDQEPAGCAADGAARLPPAAENRP
jgi:ArsR family transcriptional regulator